MSRFIIFFILAIGTHCWASDEDNTQGHPFYQLFSPEERGRWAIAYSNIHTGEAVVEFLPKGESFENWTEMVTIQYFPHLQPEVTPQLLMANIQHKIQEICPSTEWVLLEEKPGEVIYRWSTEGSPSVKDSSSLEAQEEISRLMREDEGMSRLAYVKKGARMAEEQRQKWITWVKQ